MNCETLLENLGYECEPAGEDLRVYTPFTYWDGAVIRFFAEPNGRRVRLTDHGDSLMHAEASGIKITPKRLEFIRYIAGGEATVSNRGEIFAMAEAGEIGDAVGDLLNAILTVSHMGLRWRPPIPRPSFREEVDRLLSPRLGERLQRNTAVTGASGHQYEIPFTIQTADEYRFVETVAWGEERATWTPVMHAYAEMADIAHAGAAPSSRFIILDDDADPEVVGSAVTFLAETSTVLPFSESESWLPKLEAE